MSPPSRVPDLGTFSTQACLTTFLQHEATLRFLEREGVLPRGDLPVRQLEGGVRGQLPHRPLILMVSQASPIGSWVFTGLVGPGTAGVKVTKLGVTQGPSGSPLGPSYSAWQDRCHSVPQHPGNTPRWGMGRRCSLNGSRPLAGLPRAQLDGAAYHLGAASPAWIPVLGAGRGLLWWMAGAHATPPPPFLQPSV